MLLGSSQALAAPTESIGALWELKRYQRVLTIAGCKLAVELLLQEGLSGLRSSSGTGVGGQELLRLAQGKAALSPKWSLVPKKKPQICKDDCFVVVLFCCCSGEGKFLLYGFLFVI